MIKEYWRPICGFEGFYDVSNYGRVRRLFAGGRDGWRILKLGFNRTGTGYYFVSLSRDGVVKTNCLIHHLVVAAFIGPRPKGMLVRHWNGISTDNDAINLVYGTYEENQEDRIRHGTHNKGERHGMSKLTDAQVAEIKSRYVKGNGKILAAEFNVAPHTITRIARGKTWSHVEEMA